MLKTKTAYFAVVEKDAQGNGKKREEVGKRRGKEKEVSCFPSKVLVGIN